MSADNPVSLLRVGLLVVGLLVVLPALTLVAGPFGFILAIVFILLAAIAK